MGIEKTNSLFPTSIMQPALHALPLESLTDLDLVQQIVNDNEAAFTFLMRRYNQGLYRTARSILKDDTEAEDAVQEAYLLAYKAMPGFRGDAKLGTWLVRIVVNESIGRARKRTRRAEVVHLDGTTHDDLHAAEEQMNEATPGQPETAALQAEARRLLEAKIDKLPDAFRTVFVLRALEELSVEETAASLGINEATVRSRYFRARSLLRESLSREIDSAFDTAFSFAGERCDRIVAGVLARLRQGRARDA
jgi:RNA polymerase sigma-70 factor (ECF subfamily)